MSFKKIGALAAGALAALVLVAPVPLAYKVINAHEYDPLAAYAGQDNPFPFAAHLVELKADDGVAVRGWYAPSHSRERIFILVHGIGESHRQMAPRWKSVFPDLGAVFVLDQRNHGLSDPAPTTIGYNEAMDVAAAIRYFRDKYDSVAVWGLSMGAAASVVAAKRGDRPDLLVAEGLYGSLANAVAVRGRDMGVPYFPLIPLALSYYEALSGVDLDEMDMCENIRALSGLPILLVHSAEDSLVPMESFECLKNGLDPKTGRAVLFPEGAHDGIYEANSAEYTSVLTAFVNKHER